MPASADHSLPAVHTLHLVELVERWNVSAEDLLDGFDLGVDALAEPALRLPVATVERIVERARELTGEPALGFFLGLRMRISWHGYLGFAAMSAATLGEAIALAERFAPTRTDALALRLEVEGARASLVIEERADLGRARDVVIFALLTGIWQIGNDLTGRVLEGEAEVAFSKPGYFARFDARTPMRVRFDAPDNRSIFDAALLQVPLIGADPAALRLARERCEEELDQIGYEGQLVAQARALLPDDAGGFRSLDDLARELHVSARTLKRKLAAHGTSYSALLDEHRRDLSMRLLRADDLSVEEIADRLGYSDAANFTRAFRRWTGMTPRSFRKLARSST